MPESVILIPKGRNSFSIYAKNIYRYIYKLSQSDKYLKVSGHTVEIPHWDLTNLKLRHLLFLKKLSTFTAKYLPLKGDILHLPVHSFLPYINIFRNKFKVVITTIHDLLPYLPQFPEHKEHPLILALEQKNINIVDHFITISKNTKKDLRKLFDIPPNNISVVYNGVDHKLFYPRTDNRIVKFPYILYVGSEYPRKNMISVIRSLYILKKEYPEEFKYIKLVKVGDPEIKKFGALTLHTIKKLKMEGDIIFTGYVKEKYLPYYYSHAEVFVYPSVYEGFGLPPLEAMACGCPVITSNTSSLPEVVGDAGIMVNPLNIDELTEALYRVITSESLKNKLKKKGLIRAKKFSWDKTAEEIYRIYRNII